jgi:hypothetical protein
MSTVGDVLREVLPSGTVCLAGQVALSRPTISSVVLRLRGGFADLAPGAVVLINLELLRQLPARPSLSPVAWPGASRVSCCSSPTARRGQFRSWWRR